MNKKNKLLDALRNRARLQGMSNSELCRALGIDQAFLSRWSANVLMAPDPRKASNKKFYQAAAELLEIPVFEVLEQVLFDGDGLGILREYRCVNEPELKRISKLDKSLSNTALARKIERRIADIRLNASNHDEALDLALDTMRSYIEKIKKERWNSIQPTLF